MRTALFTSVFASALGIAAVAPAVEAPVTPAPRVADLFAAPPPPLIPEAARSAPLAAPGQGLSTVPRPRSGTDPRAAGRPTSGDRAVRRAQAGPVGVPALPDAAPTAPSPTAPSPPTVADPTQGASQSLSLQAALYGAIRSNPDLVALRNGSLASPEAVEVARRFPTTLNPTLWIDYRPITLIPRDTFGSNGTGVGGGGNRPTGPFYHHGQNYFLFSLRQPIELGRQTSHRHAIAKAALSQQEWTVVQAELLALVQTYRFFQTSAYRREKLRVARELAEFNDRLLQSMSRRLEANQVQAADVVLAEVENEATRQQVDVARQDYANALADLRNQVGLPETAGTAEPLGEFVMPRNIPPIDEAALVRMALGSRPEIHAARAQAAGALAAVNLARGDRIPTPVVGPQYAIDEAGIQYVGLVLVSAIPVVNSGTPLVRQREADYRRALVNQQQIEKRTVIQVRAAAAKWNAANRLVGQTVGLTGSLRTQVERMERLFEASQADLTKLLQARQRLIQLENAELDAVWQATQAQADLLTALGAPGLIAALQAPAPAAAPTAPRP